MNITRFAIENNRTTLVLLWVILLSGAMAYSNMPRDYDPGFIIRTAQITTQFPGASPERVELLVSDKLEKVVQEIPELDFVTSESRTGVSIVKVNIKERYTEMRPIWDKLRRKIEDAKGDLPDGVIGPFVNDEFGDVFGIVLTLTGEGFTYSELKEVADASRDELLRIPEAAKVDIHGAQDQRIFVEYHNARLAELGLSPLQLTQALASRNIVVPGGYVSVGPERIALEPTGNFESLEDVKRTIIQVPGSNAVIYLEDIAEVYRAYVDPPKSKVKSSGVPALGLSISMREGGNNITLGEDVKTVLNRLQQAYPIGIEFELITFAPLEVENKVNDFVNNLLQAILVVAAVMLLTLGLRTGLIVATLIIALGMLVDNGIVMSESVMVQMASGKNSVEAAIDSASELRIPLLTSSLTTAAAFLPIYLAESSTGEYTAPLFKVVTITLLCSWLLSLTVIPLLCAHFLKVKKTEEHFDSIFYRSYRAILSGLLRFRWLCLIATIALFFVTMQGFQYIPKIFFPPSDRQYFKMELKLPLGTAIERTEAVVRDIETFIGNALKSKDESEGITSWITHIGSGGPRFVLTHSPEPPGSHYALLIINTTSATVIDPLMARLDHYTFEHFPDLLVTLKRFENGAPVKNPVEIRLFGKESDRLFDLVAQTKEKMSAIPGTKNINDDWGRRIKKLVVHINQARVRRAGVSSQDIAVSLQTGLSGLELTQYREGDQVIPVVMRSTAADRQDIGKLETLAVYAQATGDSVPLKQVADIKVVWEPAKILRRDRLKTVTVGAQLEPGITASSAFAQLIPWLNEVSADWEVGYRYEPGGEMEGSAKANTSIAAKLPITVFIVILLLVAQFNSIRLPVIILCTIPLGVIGVVIGLLVAKSYFGFMTLLGIISLAGIVVNNAIVLLERIKLEIEVNRRAPQGAILEAG